ncbi:MAG: YwaF family protein [Clostridia bacterium]|nr:YwaF family protein [Clostridia bacterium]
MYNFLHELLSDKKGGKIFTLFSGWHFLYIALSVIGIVIILLAFKNKTKEQKSLITKTLIGVAFGLYIVDFFLMPLAYNEIDIEKLPFHACTATCVACFLSYQIPLFKKYRSSIVLLAFVSNLVYLIYPAGVMWHAVSPLSYRVIQTLIFHSIMTVYGFLSLFYERENITFKTWYKDLTVICIMTVWAIIGNYIYNGTSQNYSHFFNWFFVVRDPFYMFPENIAPFIMPFLNIALFGFVEMLIHVVIGVLNKKIIKNK